MGYTYTEVLFQVSVIETLTAYNQGFLTNYIVKIRVLG